MRIKTVSLLFVFIVALMAATPAWAEITVSRALFCTAIEEREPVNPAENFTTDVGQVYFFAEIMGATEPTDIKHVWYWNDEKVAEIDMTINGPRWRTWSYKTITDDMAGRWSVEVVDMDGNVLGSASMEIK